MNEKDAVERLEELASNFRTTENEIREVQARIEANQKLLYGREQELMVQKKGNVDRVLKKESLAQKLDQSYAQLSELQHNINMKRIQKDENFQSLKSAERNLEQIENQLTEQTKDHTQNVNKLTEDQLDARNKFRDFMNFTTLH
jgi:hypothetical protein